MTEAELELQTLEAFKACWNDENPSLEYRSRKNFDNDVWNLTDNVSAFDSDFYYRIRPVPPEPPFTLTREWFGLHPTWLRCSADMDPRLVIGFCLDGAVTHLSELSFSRLQNQKWQALRAGVDSKWIDLSTGKTDEMKKCGGFNEYPTGPLCRECERKLAEVQ